MTERNRLNGHQKYHLAKWMEGAANRFQGMTREKLAEYAQHELKFTVTAANVAAAQKSVGVVMRSRTVQIGECRDKLDAWMRARAEKLSKNYVNRKKLAAMAKRDLNFTVTEANIRKSMERVGVMMPSGLGEPRYRRRSEAGSQNSAPDLFRRVEELERTVRRVDRILTALCESLGMEYV